MSLLNSKVIDCSDSPSLTKQSDKDAADINKILKRYAKTGVLHHVTTVLGKYGDFSELPDFHTASNAIAEASQAFDLLPAKVRERFKNDVGALIDFCNDSNNRDEAIKLGLIEESVLDNKVSPKVSAEASNGVLGEDKPKA